MRHKRISLVSLRASAQPRPLLTDAVDKLAASIREIGLIQPITVQAAVVMNGLSEHGFQIVAGHHRVAACRVLGWTEIDAIVIDAAEHMQAELIEIDENLCRSELTATQRSNHIKRRKTIWEAMHPADKGGKTVPTLGGVQQVGFASETASVSGMTKRSINQHLARAEALGDDLDRIQGTSLDRGVELDALKSMPKPERKELIERAVAGGVVSAKKLTMDPICGWYMVNLKSKSLQTIRRKLQSLLAEIDHMEADGADSRLAKPAGAAPR